MCRIPPKSRTRARINAFTLVEILVVIGIVALLLGILVPTVSKARESSRTTACLSNLRQLTAAAYNYAADHNNYIIPVGNSAAGGSSYWWCNILVDGKYIPAPSDPGAGPQMGGVFFCPSGYQDEPPTISILPTSRADETGAMRLRRLSTVSGISVDVWYGINGEDPLTTNPMTRGTPCRRLQHAVDRMTPMSVVKQPAEMVLFFDGILYNQTVINANRVNARHGHKTQTNIGFFDGHAETFQTQDLPGGMNATPADFSLISLQAKYPRPLWLLEQQY
jgi:prepilin-type processing-associated H-X9-DG protein